MSGSVNRFDLLLRRQALDHLYLSSEEPATLPAAHLTWHGPFLYALADEPLERQLERARRGGELWLRNFDLRTARELVISHRSEAATLVFSRAQRPGEKSGVAGPLPVRAVGAGGTPTPCGRFLYLELAEITVGRTDRQGVTP
jgi:hypothetical protein